MVAAVLDLHIGARAGAEAFDQMRGGLVTDMMSLTLTRSVPSTPKPREGLGLELLLIADDVVDLVHGGEARGIDLRRAAGDDDLGVGMLAPGSPDRLARLAHRSAVTAQVLTITAPVEPGVGCMLAHDLRFIGIEPATEGDDVEIGHWRLLT